MTRICPQHGDKKHAMQDRPVVAVAVLHAAGPNNAVAHVGAADAQHAARLAAQAEGVS